MNRSRKYIFTWNSPPDDFTTLLDNVECKYIIAGREVAPTTGQPHLQGFVYYTQAKSFAAVRRHLTGCHIEIARGTPEQCITYCRKEDPSPYERGTAPMSQRAKGDAEKERWDAVWVSAKSGDLESIPSDIRIRFYSSIRRIERDFMPPVARLGGPCGVWIHGVAGSGKSRSVLDQFPEAYPKPRTKWWDGYQGESVVYCDDVDIYDVALGGSLKLWSDAYPFIGENKGGSKKIRPTRFIVTSQYKIEEIWKDEETQAALLRRFVIIEKILGQNIII